MENFKREIENNLRYGAGVSAGTASVAQLYDAVSRAAMGALAPKWNSGNGEKRACYFSAEFLVGRLVYSNLLNLGLLEDCNNFLRESGVDAGVFEEIEDDALGNGGLGRLAACFLDSAATHDIPLDGFGIRYRYGLFKQYFEDGFQKETADDWTRFGDPWSVRRDDETELVRFRGQTVRAVPYDMPVIGYGGKTVNTLRLWQAEAVNEFDFNLFNKQEYDLAVAEKNRAAEISAVLYPNDDTDAGKALRLKQQYFFSSASLQCLLRRYVKTHGADFSAFSKTYAIQLNDTHPVVSIPELLRILMADYCLSFDKAFAVITETFAYTNHTIMTEALEKWGAELFRAVLPDVYPYVVMLDDSLGRDLCARGICGAARDPYRILADGKIHMARLATYAGHSVNGVARIHSELVKKILLPEWYAIYPERFNNKTNGITQRRWLALCNPTLSAFITDRIGDGWITQLDELKRLAPYQNDPASLAQFRAIKRQNKVRLADYVRVHEYGFELNPDFVFDVQVKRLHEYKRQLLAAFSILDLYFGIKDGSIKGTAPVAFLFGAKAAPGYRRAKGVIKFINEIAALVNGDPAVSGLMQVLFVQNYNVSYAEKLVPAADISEQISTAGTEASGTGNMKLMLSGAVTLGTLDGANIEIVEQSGAENNYIFGATVDEIAAISATYEPGRIYKEQPRVKRVVDTLIDDTFSDGGTGIFRELYDSLLVGTSWHRPDQYYLLLDLIPYCDTRLRALRDYGDHDAFTHKCFANTQNAGKFSSDRTVMEYAAEIWGVTGVTGEAGVTGK